MEFTSIHGLLPANEFSHAQLAPVTLMSRWAPQVPTMKSLAPLLALLFSLPSSAEPIISQEDAARIVRSATRLVVAKPDVWTFAIVTEMPSEKYVQFSAENKVITFDFPVLAASKPGVKGPLRDADCSTSPPLKRSDEVEKRHISTEEEARLKNFLSTTGHKWKTRYCLSQTKDGKRMGYNASVIGSLAAPKLVPPFVERVFKDVYLLPAIRSIEIETDE